MTHPHFSGRKGQGYKVYHHSGSITANGAYTVIMWDLDSKDGGSHPGNSGNLQVLFDVSPRAAARQLDRGRSKATAALRGESLKEFVSQAGDLESVDVLGARRSGIFPILIDPFHEKRSEDYLVLKSVTDLPEALEIENYHWNPIGYA